MNQLDEQAKISGVLEYRAHPRTKVAIGAAMRKRSEAAIQILVRDISLTGFRAEWPLRMRPGDLVWLRLPGLDSLEATVAWYDKGHIGCQFITPLYDAVFENILKRAED